MFAQSTQHENSDELCVVMALVPVWDTSERTQVLPRVGEFICGSDVGCDVRVRLKGVASEHCRIYSHNGVCTVVAISNNRVWINDVPVTSPERLRAGDALAVGPATFRVDYRHETAEANAASVASANSRRGLSAAAMNSASADILRHIQELEERIAAAESTSKRTPPAETDVTATVTIPVASASALSAPNALMDDHSGDGATIADEAEELEECSFDDSAAAAVTPVAVTPVASTRAAATPEITAIAENNAGEDKAAARNIVPEVPAVRPAAEELTFPAMPNALLSRLTEVAAASGGVLIETPATLKAREARLDELEQELDRRSEMLQQQLSLFKERQKQLKESAQAAKAEQEAARRAAEAERDQMLAEAREKAAQIDADIRKKTSELGRQSQSLQRKHRGVEDAHAEVVRKQRELKATAEQLEADKASHDESSAAERAELARQIADVQATYAEINRVANDAKASQTRIQKREQELKAFEEELSLKHSEVQQQSQDFQETSRRIIQQASEFDAIRAEQKATREELEATAARQQAEAQAATEALTARSQSIEQQEAQLKQRTTELREQSERQAIAEEAVRRERAELQAARAELDAARHQQVEDANTAAQRLQAEADAVREQSLLLETERAQFVEAQRIHLDDIAGKEARLQTEQQAIQKQVGELASAQEALAAAQKSHRDEVELLSQQMNQQRAEFERERSALDEAESRIAKAEAELQARTEAIQREAALLQEKTQQFEIQTQQESEDLIAARKQIESLEATLEQSRLAYAELETSMASAETVDLVNSRLETIEAREAELTKRHAQLTEQFAKSAEMQQRLKQEAARIDAEQSERMVAEAEWNRSTADRTAALEAREKALSIQTNELAAQREAAAEDARNRQDSWDSLDVLSAEVKAKAAKFDARQSELEAWSQELERRHEEMAGRVQHLKQLAAAAPAAGAASTTAESLSVAESHKYAQELEDARRHAETVSAERDELAIAVSELKAAFEVARDELARRQNTNADADNQTAALLLQREAELQAIKSELDVANGQNVMLEQQLRSFSERLEAEQAKLEARQGLLDDNSAASSEFADEMALMKQVEELKAELATAAKNSDHSPGEFTDQVRAYEQTIQELRSELAEATAAANQAQNNEATSPNADESQLLSIISELKEKLHEQSLEISELTNSRAVDGANAAGSDDGSHSVEELHTLHKELDERTNLLDGREEEIRERKRKLEQSEEEIESQRRQLLEARQQLEQARAEIQLAMQSRNTESDDSDSHVDLDDYFAPHHSRTRSTEREEQRAPAVRSEIAELFGIKVGEKKQEEKLPERVESLLPAVDDYSQEAAAAVSMSFTRAESVLLEAPPKVADTKEEPVKSEDGDDFVASYMEQLLSRNREKAGGSLPQELKKPGQKSSGSAPASSQPQKPAASAPEAKKPAVQKSFIDSYMSGAYDSETVSAVAEVTAEAYEEPQKAPKRAKIDLDSLRSNMDSFRELSTRSVENALASHAKRQEKGGITARSTIFISLSVVTLLVTVAAVLSVIPFGVPVWLLILATIASGAELYVKMSAIKKKVQTKSVTLTKGTNQDGSVSVPQARQDAPQRPAAVLDMDGSQKTEVAGPIEAPEVLDAADMIEAKPPAAQREEEKYFEL